MHFRVDSRSVADTIRIGESLGRHAVAGDVICLIGDLGAGKTHLAQGVALGLGLPSSTATSPTYSLIAEHTSGRLPLYHMDAYRLADSSELGPIGFDDYLSRSDGVLVIEWADRIRLELPPDRVEIEMLIAQDSDTELTDRILDITPFGERAVELAALSLGIL